MSGSAQNMHTDTTHMRTVQHSCTTFSTFLFCFQVYVPDVLKNKLGKIIVQPFDDGCPHPLNM